MAGPHHCKRLLTTAGALSQMGAGCRGGARRGGRGNRNSAGTRKMGGFNFYLAIPRERNAADEGRRKGRGGHLTLLPLPQLPHLGPWPPPAGAARLATKNTRQQSFLALAHNLTQTLLTPSLPAGVRTPRCYHHHHPLPVT